MASTASEFSDRRDVQRVGLINRHPLHRCTPAPSGVGFCRLRDRRTRRSCNRGGPWRYALPASDRFVWVRYRAGHRAGSTSGIRPTRCQRLISTASRSSRGPAPGQGDRHGGEPGRSALRDLAGHRRRHSRGHPGEVTRSDHARRDGRLGGGGAVLGRLGLALSRRLRLAGHQRLGRHAVGQHDRATFLLPIPPFAETVFTQESRSTQGDPGLCRVDLARRL
jgi:hypothetical protein